MSPNYQSTPYFRPLNIGLELVLAVAFRERLSARGRLADLPHQRGESALRHAPQVKRT